MGSKILETEIAKADQAYAPLHASNVLSLVVHMESAACGVDVMEILTSIRQNRRNISVNIVYW